MQWGFGNKVDIPRPNMQFSESWLRSFCNPSMSTDELAHALTMAGLEVEEVTPAAPPFTGIVVGEIVTREQHPNDPLACRSAR